MWKKVKCIFGSKLMEKAPNVKVADRLPRLATAQRAASKKKMWHPKLLSYFDKN